MFSRLLKQIQVTPLGFSFALVFLKVIFAFFLLYEHLLEFFLTNPSLFFFVGFPKVFFWVYLFCLLFVYLFFFLGFSGFLAKYSETFCMV